MLEESRKYRTHIYARYASDFQDATKNFDQQASIRWGKAYECYLRGWLPMSKQASIAEVACGGGRMLHFLKTEGYTNLWAVDISPEQVALAQQVILNVTAGDAIQYLEGRPSSFDLIIGLDIIEHLYKAEVLRFLDACHNALKSEGRLILQTPNMDSPWGLSHLYNDLTHEIGFNVNLLSRLLRRAGFDDVEARETGPVPFGYSFASTLRYICWKIFRAALMLWNFLETGNSGAKVFTRVFLISGLKK